jgi:hypothetical protein
MNKLKVIPFCGCSGLGNCSEPLYPLYTNDNSRGYC